MIILSEIQKREQSLKFTNVFIRESSMNIDVLKDNAKISNKRDILESYFRRWEESDVSNEYAFVEAVNILEGYCKRNNKKDSKQMIDLFETIVIPEVYDMKKAKKVLQQFIKENHIGDSLLESCNNYIIYDRVINNRNKIMKQNNISDIVKEFYLGNIDNLQICVNELCNVIDSYNMSFPIKFNVALENVLYEVSKADDTIKREVVAEMVTNYFLCSVNESSLKDMRKILIENPLYDNNTNLDWLIHNEAGCKSKPKKDIKEDIYQYTNDEDIDVVLDSDSIVDEATNINPFQKAMQSFKTSVDKSPAAMKKVINALYVLPPDKVIEELPSYLNWTRTFLVFGTFGINPYLGIITFFADQMVRLHFQKQDTSRAIKKFEKEREKAKRTLDKTKNPKVKERMTAYIKTLDSNISKLEQYEETLYTEEENDKRMDDKFNSDSDMSFDESGIILNELSTINDLKIVMNNMKTKTQNLSDKEKIVSRQMDSAVSRFTNKVQLELTNKNREAVIKGSILPSFSAILKIAIGSGVALLINPAIAVVGIVGGIAAAKIGTEKERQFILDELEIENKIIEKKIAMAERNDDTKSMQELLRLQQRINREITRIQYHKKDYRPIRKQD